MVDMSSQMFKGSLTIAGAIRALRQKLGQTQADMARTLGTTLRTYDRWEAGDSIPRGHVLIRMMELCPDPATRSLFRIAAGSGHAKLSARRPVSPPLPRRDPRDRLRMHLRNACLEAIEIIYQAAAMGSAAAEERLRHYAAELNRNAISLAASALGVRKDAGSQSTH